MATTDPRVAAVAAQLAYLREADAHYGPDAHTDTQRAETILAVIDKAQPATLPARTARIRDLAVGDSFGCDERIYTVTYTDADAGRVETRESQFSSVRVFLDPGTVRGPLGEDSWNRTVTIL